MMIAPIVAVSWHITIMLMFAHDLGCCGLYKAVPKFDEVEQTAYCLYVLLKVSIGILWHINVKYPTRQTNITGQKQATSSQRSIVTKTHQYPTLAHTQQPLLFRAHITYNHHAAPCHRPGAT